MSALERAIKIAGSQGLLARAIGRRQSDVWYWLHKRNACVPAEVCELIEKATGVPREELRPDLWPKERRAS
jgi:DNA-binding transcriptional regulator YdaS (Cro superfamily)